ncbi:MAG: hypothetical protein K0R63_1, partial [Rickettsiales bacterium]|nr:hypothetical protein [Rickettsiales bacterium]
MPNIAANEDTFKYRDSSSGVTVGVSSMTGADYNPYVGFDTSKSKSDGTAYTNASLVAGGNIVTYSGRDTNIAGANFLAGEILSMDVGRALNVATLQNSMQSKSYSASVTIGKSGSTGFSGSYGEGDRKFADNQTTLIGREGVSVNVKGETTMFGSLIANIDTNGIDQGNLVLNTAKLNAFDLVNT